MNPIFFIIAILWLLVSCATNRETTAAEAHTNDVSVAYHELSDSQSVNSSAVIRTAERTSDSLIVDRTRIVREADSIEMADYGIHINGPQKAYVVFEKEVRERIRQLEALSADTFRAESSNERRSLERDSTSHSDLQREAVKQDRWRYWLGYLCVTVLVINAVILFFIVIRNKF